MQFDGGRRNGPIWGGVEILKRLNAKHTREKHQADALVSSNTDLTYLLVNFCGLKPSMREVEVFSGAKQNYKTVTHIQCFVFSVAFMLVGKPPSQCARRNLTLVSHHVLRLISK